MSPLTPKSYKLATSLAPLAVLFGLCAEAANTKPFTVEPIAGIAGHALPVSVHLPEDLGSPSDGPIFILFREVPAEITFSAGFRAGRGWLISVKDLNGLMLISRPDYAGVIELEVALYRGKNQRHLTYGARVDLTEEPPTSAQAVGSLSPAPKLPPNRQRQTGLALPEVAELLQRADTLLHSGDFESARLIYSALADNGIAQAAILMAQTYDPEVLKKSFVIGMSPDIRKAIRWYRRAVELGEDGARRRLDSLAAEK